MAKISVIVPIYKVEPYLRRCVDSILAQTYRDFELILVDDGSPDNCGKICDEYAKQDARVVVIHREYGGVSVARNSGMDWMFANSNSEYLAFVDSDDWVDESYLQELYKGICLGCEIAAVAAFRDENRRLVGTDEEWRKVEPSVYWMKSIYKNSPWGKLFKRQLFESVRFPVGKIYEDAYTIYKVVFARPAVAYCAKPLYWYFKRVDSIMGTKWSVSRLQQIPPLKEQLEFFETNGQAKVARFVAVELARSLSAAVAGLRKLQPSSKVLEFKTELRELLHRYQLSLADRPDLWLTIAPIRAWIMKTFLRVTDVLRRRGLFGAMEIFFKRVV